jgi:hypothetical protein
LIGPAPIVPTGFDVPAETEAEGFSVLPLTWRRFPEHYEAYRASPEQVAATFGPDIRSPFDPDSSSELAAIAAAWAEMEATVWRSSFTYVVVDAGSGRALGACYVARSTRGPYRIECRCWTRPHADVALGESVHPWLGSWIERRWPFGPGEVAWPGRDPGWHKWLGLDQVSIEA